MIDAPADNHTEKAPARLALGLSYVGTHFHGWQTQTSGRAVEDHLRLALTRFMGEPSPDLVCAGRTDAGVHAAMQVVHFDTSIDRDEFSWIRGLNRYLPGDMSIHWAKPVAADFHARFSAVTRRYAYVVRESPIRPSLDRNRVGWCFRPLNHAAMLDAASRLVGTHDFSSFRAAQCQAKSPIRNLLKADVSRSGIYWRFDFEANAFLHHMIRNILGCLIAVGNGTRPATWVDDLIAAKSRALAAPTFAPDGLYFIGPTYNQADSITLRTDAHDWIDLMVAPT